MAGNKALWSDVSRDIAAAQLSCAGAIERAKSLRLRGDRMPDDVRLDRELTIGTLIGKAYGAMEAALERLMREVDGGTPTEGRTYHVDLVRRAAAAIDGVRPPMITKELAEEMQTLRAFRHVVRHDYGEFVYSRAAPNVAVAASAVRKFSQEIAVFAEKTGIKDPSPKPRRSKSAKNPEER